MFLFEGKKHFTTALVRILAELDKPRSITAIYEVKKQFVTEPSPVSADQPPKRYIKRSVRPLTAAESKHYTGNVLLKYEDGTSAFCILSKGTLDGMYERYAQPEVPGGSPLNVGSLLETGPYHAGKRDGIWHCPVKLAGITKFSPRVNVQFKSGNFVEAQARESFWAGTWYTIKANELKDFIEKYPGVTKVGSHAAGQRPNPQNTRG